MPGNQTKATTPQSGQTTPDISTLGSGASEKLSQVFEQVAAIAKAAALRRASQEGGAGGGNIMQTSMPGVQAPIFAGQHIVPSGVTPEGGNYDYYGDRVAYDKARLLNQMGQAADVALANHKEKDQAMKQRQYEIIMTAMAGLKSPDPAIRKQNADVLNHMFDGPEGKKRAQAIAKSMGYDAFDPVKEKKKQEDPDYQAIHAAASNMQQQVPGANIRTGAQDANGLNDTASSFVKMFPQVDTGRQYNPSDSEIADKWRIDNKLKAGGDVSYKADMEYNTQLLKTTGELGIKDSEILSNEYLEGLKQSQENWRKVYGEENAYRIALLQSEVQASANALKAWELRIKAGTLPFDTAKEMAGVAMTGYEKALQYEKNLRDAVNQAAQNKTWGSKGVIPPDVQKELDTARQTTIDAKARVDNIWTTFSNAGGKLGATETPNGSSAGKSVVEGLEGTGGTPTKGSTANGKSSRPNSSTNRNSETTVQKAIRAGRSILNGTVVPLGDREPN